VGRVAHGAGHGRRSSALMTPSCHASDVRRGTG
jgi:hypothetical protein